MGHRGPGGTELGRMNAVALRAAFTGGLWLNMTRPGWRDQIDWNALDMGRGDLCVGGQAFRDRHGWAVAGGYGDGYSFLCTLLDLPDRRALGFTVSRGNGAVTEWDLAEAWRALWGPDAAPCGFCGYPDCTGVHFGRRVS